MAFHQALINNPQHSFVVLTFGSVLYHQSWEDGLNFARKYGQSLVSFDPETTNSCKFISDDEVAKKVKYLAMRVIDSIDILVDTDILHNTMSKFPGSPCSGLVSKSDLLYLTLFIENVRLFLEMENISNSYVKYSRRKCFSFHGMDGVF